MRRTRGDDFQTPITVSQIYQELVPYRVARANIGFEMNADYEFALLRLLGGERDLARLEPAEVREMLSKEADSPNPNVSLFRAYANCDVWVTPPQDWITEMVDEPEPEFEVELESTPEPAEPWEPESMWEPDLPEAVPATPTPSPSTRFVPEPPTMPDAMPASAPGSSLCAFCGGNLPTSRLVKFCPHCGNDLTQVPCSNCGEILESNWKFCVSCGTAAGGYDAQAN